MRVPHENKVIHQSFNVNKVETTWMFPDNKLFIFGIHKNGSIYGQAGNVNDSYDWIDGNPRLHFKYEKNLIEAGFQELWYYPTDNDFNFFGSGKELLPFIEGVMKFLN